MTGSGHRHILAQDGTAIFNFHSWRTTMVERNALADVIYRTFEKNINY